MKYWHYSINYCRGALLVEVNNMLTYYFELLNKNGNLYKQYENK